MDRIPVSIVTGALGSGKTTLLNYLLTANHGIRIGVIVNEFGDVGLDADLIETSEDDIIELPNGCVCCTVRGDLVEAVGKTLERDIEYMLVETSGMAEPKPVANTFLVPELPIIRTRCKLDGIITVVDGEHFLRNEDETVREQVEAADVVLLNKMDLIGEQQANRAEQRIQEIAPGMYVFRTEHGRAPLNILLATGRFDIDRWLARGWDKREEHDHAAGYDAVSIEQDRPLRLDAITGMLRSLPAEIFRAKGILSVGNLAALEKTNRMVFQKVGKRIEITFSRDWRPNEERKTRIVLIGRNIDRKEWQSLLDGCVLHQASSS